MWSGVLIRAKRSSSEELGTRARCWARARGTNSFQDWYFLKRAPNWALKHLYRAWLTFSLSLSPCPSLPLSLSLSQASSLALSLFLSLSPSTFFCCLFQIFLIVSCVIGYTRNMSVCPSASLVCESCVSSVCVCIVCDLCVENVRVKDRSQVKSEGGRY